jgi:hypothetical protein
MTRRYVFFLKRSLLAFWAIWLTVVFATNVLDGARALGWLEPNWMFASGNYHFLVKTTSRYGTPAWLNSLLFGGVIVWEGLTAVLFWLACWRYHSEAPSRRLLYAAFTVGLLLWAGFLVADELFMAYAVEETHWRLFTAQLATLLTIELLPDEPGTLRGL